MWNYTRNGWRRCETTLETSGEDYLGVTCYQCFLKMYHPYHCFVDWWPAKTTLETSGEQDKLHSKRVGNKFYFWTFFNSTQIGFALGRPIHQIWEIIIVLKKYTRFECSFTSSPLVSSVNIPHFRCFESSIRLLVSKNHWELRSTHRTDDY